MPGVIPPQHQQARKDDQKMVYGRDGSGTPTPQVSREESEGYLTSPLRAASDATRSFFGLSLGGSAEGGTHSQTDASVFDVSFPKEERGRVDSDLD